MDNGPLETTPEQRQEDALENEVFCRWGYPQAVLTAPNSRAIGLSACVVGGA
jgi:hypothetical protein